MKATAKRSKHEAGFHEAIKEGTYYKGSKQSRAINKLLRDVSKLPDEVYEAVGGTVLGLVRSVARKEAIRITDDINPKRVQEIAEKLGKTGASTAASFMASMSEELGGPYVPYAGEAPIHVVLPLGVIPRFPDVHTGGLQLPALPA